MPLSRLVITLPAAFVLIAALAAGSAPAAEDEKPEQVRKENWRLLHLPMSENGGWCAHDLSGRHLHAMLFHPSWQKPANDRQAVLRFDGARTWGRVPQNDAFGVTVLTLTAWARPLSLPKDVAILSNRATADGFAFGLDEQGRIYFSPARDVLVWSEQAVKVGEWSHLAVTYDGKDCRFFVNGEPAGAEACDAPLVANSEGLFIGTLATPGTGSPKFHGDLYDLRALARSVPAEAVRQLVAMTRSRGIPKVFVLPVRGTIGDVVPARLLAEGIEAAQAAKADVLLLDVDSPGGRVSSASAMIETMEGLQGLQTAAYVGGGQHNGAYSAAAAISLCTHRIVMAPGATIGAATAIVVDSREGVRKAAPKFQAVWRARVRAGATAGGHAPALGDAMIESKGGVSCGRIDGTPVFGTAEELQTIAGQVGPAFEPGSTLAREGQILALTGADARRVGFAFATAASLEEALEHLGLTGAEVVRFDKTETILAQHAKEVKDVEKKGKALRALLESLRPLGDKIHNSRPDAQPYGASAGNEFRKQWRDASKRCIDACNDYLKAVREILSFHKKNRDWELDEHLDLEQLRRSEETIEELRKQVRKHQDTATYLRLM